MCRPTGKESRSGRRSSRRRPMPGVAASLRAWVRRRSTKRRAAAGLSSRGLSSTGVGLLLEQKLLGGAARSSLIPHPGAPVPVKGRPTPVGAAPEAATGREEEGLIILAHPAAVRAPEGLCGAGADRQASAEEIAPATFPACLPLPQPCNPQRCSLRLEPLSFCQPCSSCCRFEGAAWRAPTFMEHDGTSTPFFLSLGSARHLSKVGGYG
jgi:hypothetical protein